MGHHRMLSLGLILNAIALGGLVLAAVAMFVLACASGEVSAGWKVLIFFWSVFTLGTLFMAIGTPKGTRFKAVGLFGLSLISNVFLINRQSGGEFGGVLSVLAMLVYCSYQDTLARWLDDAELKMLIKRAYDWPFKIFSLGIVVVFLASLGGSFFALLAVPAALVAFVGCPVWGFAYLSVVTVHLLKALRSQKDDPTPVRARAEF